MNRRIEDRCLAVLTQAIERSDDIEALAWSYRVEFVCIDGGGRTTPQQPPLLGVVCDDAENDR